MRALIKKSILGLALSSFLFTACKKEETDSSNSDVALAQSGAVAIASTKSVVGVSGSLTDSIYAVAACPPRFSRTPVAQADLLANITTYLTTNYTDYTFLKAFSISLSGSTTIESYVVAVNFNGKPVALKFAADGTFVKVFELREGGDLRKGRDHHIGGCFEGRDGKQRDSIAVAALAATIKTYLNTNYPQDTLKAAWLNKDASIIVLTKNVKFYTNVFTAAGVFVKRTEMPAKPGKDSQIAQADLPATVLTYLNTTYPNYVFKKAFVMKNASGTNGYMVVIDANLTKYGVLFDASGAFVSSKIIR